MTHFGTEADAMRKVEKRTAIGAQEEAALLQTVAKTIIVDKLVPPESMVFERDEEELKLSYQMSGSMMRQRVTLHSHAFGQLCAKVNIPMNFANMLRTVERSPEDWWKPELLALNLNTFFHKTEWKGTSSGPARFLHRIVDGELRGFLSRRYNRFLASAPLLSAFVDVCRFQGAKPIEASSTPVRSALKCIMPQVYEPFPGEYICIGVEWSNSDFGAGKLAVCQTVWRILTGSSSVLDESISRVHLGSIIQDSDLEVSDDTARKEVTAQQAAIADVVTQQLSDKTIERLVKAMKTAHEEEIPWSRLRSQLQRILNKSELEWMESCLDMGAKGIIDLPPVSFAPDHTTMPNSYWAASTLALLASECGDEDKKLDLQKAAGALLSSALKS